jgi:hypothetical protein
MLYECPVVQLPKQLYDFPEMKMHLRQDFEKYCVLLQNETSMVIALYYVALFSM